MNAGFLQLAHKQAQRDTHVRKIYSEQSKLKKKLIKI
eukprot:UN01851